MLIDISNIGPEGLALDKEIPLERLSLEGGIDARLSRPALRARISPGARGMELKGELSTRAALTCVRCLERFEFAIQREFRLVLIPGPDETAAPAGGGGEPDPAGKEDEADTLALSGARVDLVEVVREQVDLALPMNPVCRSDCRGLCMQCGARLDEGPCGCPDRAPDPRWSALRDWRGRTHQP